MGGCCGCDDDEPKESPPRQTSPMRKNVCCTDIVFLILFIAFWAGMVYIAVFSLLRGDGWRLIYGYDSFGNTCNRQNNEPIENVSLSGNDTTGLTNVFFLDMLDPFDSMEVCIKKCPPDFLRTKEEVKQFAENEGVLLCRYDIPVSEYLDQNYDRTGPCPELPVYPSFSVLNRCVPDPSKIVLTDRNATAFNDMFSFLSSPEEFVREVLADLYSAWKEMLVLFFVALVLSGLMVVCIRYLAAVIVYVIVALSVIGSIVGTGLLWWNWYLIKESLDADENFDMPILSIDISNQNAFLGFSITATVFTVILLLLLLVMRKRLALVVTLFGEAGKCLASIPILLLQPLWTFIILIAFLFLWLFVFAYVHTTGDPMISDKEGFEKVYFTRTVEGDVFWWYYIVGVIWTSEFILACQQMVISGAVATWYFTRNKKELSCVVGKSTCRLILHHIGSVAIGSFIITLVKLPRYILMYIQAKCKGSESTLAKCCLKCCICCLWCLEKALKFLNQNAYTVVAIEGKSFFSAACAAFKIIASNVLRVAAINSVGDFVLFLGKVAVMAGTCAISIVWLRNDDGSRSYYVMVLLTAVVAFIVADMFLTIYETLGLHIYAIPVLLVTIFAFLIAHCFLTIYEMVVDTLLLCFCEDVKLNDGTAERPYFMSDSLMKFVKDSSKKMKMRREQEAAAEANAMEMKNQKR